MVDSYGYGGEQPQYSYKLPDQVREFFARLQIAFRDNDQAELKELYEVTFPNLTEDFFKTQPWPHASEIPEYFQDDKMFQVLYVELYFRHIYARVPSLLTIDERYASFYNYCEFFGLILNAEEPLTMSLPNQWLYDLVDEFIYHFHSWARFQSNMVKRTEEELQVLRNERNIWSVKAVLNILHSLVEKSNINDQLKAYAEGRNVEKVAGEFGQKTLYKMLGYFSLIGLCRIHTCICDYYEALKVLENVQLNVKNVYSRVPVCQITTYYYVGFCYLMMRRYADAIRTFSQILVYIQRARQLFLAKNYQNDQINKQTEQMYNLLAICLALNPQRIDESVMSVLREKPYSDRMAGMQKPDLKEFETTFAFSCPKFISPVPPAPEMPVDNYDKEPMQLQVAVFIAEVKQQLFVPVIRSYLKLYTTMPIAKIGSFLGVAPEEFLSNLLCFKHKMTSLVCTKSSSGLEGDFQADSEVDFYIDRDMIHIADTKVAPRYGDFFIRQIHKYEDLHMTLKGQPFPGYPNK